MEVVKIIPKKEICDLGFKLSHKEFKCKCNKDDCNFTLINPRLIEAWTVVRAQFGKPLQINSGFRCQKHNTDVKGRPNSKHLRGQAIDISFKDLDNMESTFLKTLLERNFDTVLEYINFYHCHIN